MALEKMYDPETPKLIPSEEAMKGINADIAPTGQKPVAREKIAAILEDMKTDGHTVPTTIDGLIQAKKNLDKDGKLFVNGPAGSDLDPVNTALRRKMYLNITDAIGELSPEIKAMNTEGKRLLDVHAAFSDAAVRNAHHDAAGLTDFVLGGATLAHPGSWAVAAPLFVAKKAAGNGRLGNALINAGRNIAGKTDKTIEGTFNDLNVAKNPKHSLAYDSHIEMPERAAGTDRMVGNQAAYSRLNGRLALPEPSDQYMENAKQQALGKNRLGITYEPTLGGDNSRPFDEMIPNKGQRMQRLGSDITPIGHDGKVGIYDPKTKQMIYVDWDMYQELLK
jgi:hypothetical protein